MKERILRVLRAETSSMNAMELKKRVLGIDDIVIRLKVQDFELTLQRMISNGELKLDEHFQISNG